MKRLRTAIRRGLVRIKQIRLFNAKRRRTLKRLEAQAKTVSAMFDSVDLNQVPANAPAVAGYTSGTWPTYWDLAKRFPRAYHLAIAVDAGHDATALDVEPGDATPAQAAAWVRRQLDRGVLRPVVYCSVSSMGALLAELAAGGIKRRQVRLWTAHYTFSPHLCGPHSCGLLSAATADATQWTDQALGRNLDQSLLAEDFFK